MSIVNNYILKLISLYTTKEITESEYKELENWIHQSDENKEIFTDYLLLYKKSRQLSFVDAIDKNKAWHQIVSKLETPLEQVTSQKKSTVFSLYHRFYKYAAAAIVVGLIATTYFLSDGFFTNQHEAQPILVNSNNTIETGTDKATLTLEDGSVVELTNGTSFQTKNATSNGKELVYTAAEKTPPKIAYNILTVPRGGQFFIKLSDGTQVWLNSETQIKYPISFVAGKIREVSLVYGEAYFDVSPSSEHQGAAFKVLHNHQEINVIGTEFNVKAYKDETSIYTTLVEGKVAVTTENKLQQLLPNQQLQLDVNTNSYRLQTVDVDEEISWKKGIFSFRKKSLEDIMKVLSRWYDLEVKFENQEIKKSGFNGIIGKDQKIEEILEIIKNYGVLKEYEIKDKTVLLK
jgi:transmembrane sensor